MAAEAETLLFALETLLLRLVPPWCVSVVWVAVHRLQEAHQLNV